VTTERVGGDIPQATPGATQKSHALSGRIRPGLFAGSTRLVFADLDFARVRSAKAVQFTLSCRDNEVVGVDNGSGTGARAGSSGRLGLPWWDQPATVRARLDDLESNELSVLCDGS